MKKIGLVAAMAAMFGGILPRRQEPEEVEVVEDGIQVRMHGDTRAFVEGLAQARDKLRELADSQEGCLSPETMVIRIGSSPTLNRAYAPVVMDDVEDHWREKSADAAAKMKRAQWIRETAARMGTHEHYQGKRAKRRWRHKL